MFTRNRVHTHESGTSRRNRSLVHSVLAVYCLPSHRVSAGLSKEPHLPDVSGRRGINISGVDFWHAVEFSRNGRFLCALSVLIDSVPGSPGASLRSCVSDSIRSLRFRFSPVRFGLSASSRFQPYQIRFRLRPPVGVGLAFLLSLSGHSDCIRSEPRRFRSNFDSDFPSEGFAFRLLRL